MSVQPTTRMTVDAFLAWAEGREGRHELVDGAIVAMSPQTARHARIKYRVQSALDRAIAVAGLPCEMLPDGMSIRVDAQTVYEPDALVQCGPRIAEDSLLAGSPIVVVEVLSPSTRHIDAIRKLEGYFRVPSVMHYLIVDPKRPMVIHHRRGDEAVIATRIVTAGHLDLRPPGLSLDVADFFAQP